MTTEETAPEDDSKLEETTLHILDEYNNPSATITWNAVTSRPEPEYTNLTNALLDLAKKLKPGEHFVGTVTTKAGPTRG